MPDRDYSHRDAVDKLGVKPGQRLALAEVARPLEADLRRRVLERGGSAPAERERELDLVLLTADAATPVRAELEVWRSRLQPAGAIWVLTPKRGRPGYVDQREVMAAGLAAGLVDNKSCSVSDAESAVRFVLRRRDRPAGRSVP